MPSTDHIGLGHHALGRRLCVAAGLSEVYKRALLSASAASIYRFDPPTH
jgi:hypothetical protein